MATPHSLEQLWGMWGLGGFNSRQIQLLSALHFSPPPPPPCLSSPPPSLQLPYELRSNWSTRYRARHLGSCSPYNNAWGGRNPETILPILFLCLPANHTLHSKAKGQWGGSQVVIATIQSMQSLKTQGKGRGGMDLSNSQLDMRSEFHSSARSYIELKTIISSLLGSQKNQKY